MSARKNSFGSNRTTFAGGGARGGMWHLVFVGALVGIGAPALVGCGDPAASKSTAEAPGILQLGLGTEVDGVRYWLEATFDVTGPETAALSSVAGETALSQELVPGDYTVELRPDFRVLRETTEGLTQVNADLESDALQSFAIVDQATTRVSYRFSTDGTSIDFGNGELSIEFELETRSPPGPEFGAATIPASGVRSRVLYDARRRMLYGVNRGAQMLERFRYEGGEWRALPSLVVPQLSDAALTPNLASLVVASSNGIGDVQLDEDPPVLVARVPNPDPFCGRIPNGLAMGSDGQALVVFSLRQCSGFTLTARYDSATQSLVSNPYPDGLLYEGVAAASGDGTRIYAGSNGVSPEQAITAYEPPDWSATTTNAAYNLFAVSVSDDASRVVMQNTDVRDRYLALLGFLPSGGVALVSHDSSRAYVYREDGQPRLVAYALDVSPEAGALYPERGTLELDSMPSGVGLGAIALAAAPDDSAVFVSGSDTIRVLPVE